MTVFAGVVSLTENPLAPDYLESLKTAFASRTHLPIDNVDINSHSACFSANIGILTESNIARSELSVTSVAGDPILSSAPSRNLNAEIKKINNAQSLDDFCRILKQSRGTFSGVTLSRKNHETRLYVDKLGVRPIFYYTAKEVIIYSSLFSFIEDLPDIDLTPDTTGLCEYVSFGFCLANRTQYQHVKRMDAGEILVIPETSPRIRSHSYWDWGTIPIKESFNDQDISQLFTTFHDAISLRCGDDREALAFLSGGLDSRTITSLVSQRVDCVHTFNFGTRQSQDSEFARRFAAAAGFQHRETFLPEISFPNWSRLIADAIAGDEGRSVDRIGSLVWSGDGGSVSTGSVYIREDIIRMLEHGQFDDAIRALLLSLETAFPLRFLKREAFETFSGQLEHSVRDALVLYDTDPGKAAYHFLMLNDQKRHLDRHFESICEHRIELLVPFFDGDFLSKIWQVPSHELLYHRLYMRWFNLFPETTRQTPWQTYPDHLPCPIADSTTLSYQWRKQKPSRDSRKRDYKMFTVLNHRFIFRYFDKYKVLLAMLLHRLGLRDYAYLVGKLARFSSLKQAR